MSHEQGQWSMESFQDGWGELMQAPIVWEPVSTSNITLNSDLEKPSITGLVV